uniref:Major facilitator superfamily (MFS) profile domain-containing protein n=1 Tax=Anabas testudineus TaxID=64144 RepID=A0A3Q1I730_ANATE
NARCISLFFVEFQAHFGADYSATAWIHSLLDCTTMLCAPVGSLVGNRWSCRVAVMLGGVLSSCGLLLSSFATSLKLLYFSMRILTGLGFALCYTPAIAMVGCYFRQRKALAYGIAMSGSSIGTFVLAAAVQQLIEQYSWRGALLVLSAVVVNLCVCGKVVESLSILDEKHGNITPDLKRRRCLSYFLSSNGCSLPFVYLVPYALSASLSHQNAAFLMSIIDIVGNITFAIRLVCYIFSVGMDLCCLFAPLLCSFPLLILIAVLYGYFDGAYVALIPVVRSNVVGASYLPSALGVVYFLHAIPYLISPPIGGEQSTSLTLIQFIHPIFLLLVVVFIACCSFLSPLSTHPNRSRQMAAHYEPGSAGGFFL